MSSWCYLGGCTSCAYFATTCDVSPNHLPPGCATKLVGCRFGKNVTKSLFRGKASSRGFKLPLVMMHYSRSLEKYELKSKTWKTSSGEQSKADKYDIGGFSDRQLGESLLCFLWQGGCC